MITTHLKAIRERRGMRAADLAVQAGVARQTIYAIEAGSFVPNTLVALQIARALDCSVEELFAVGEGSPSELPLVDAEWAEETPAPADGAPIRVCRVGDRVIALPVKVLPAWTPGANAVSGPARSATRVQARLIGSGQPPRNSLVIAGCDPAISILSRFLDASEGIDVAAIECSSRRALELLKRGYAHIAGMHLRDDRSGHFNLPFVRKAFPRGGCQVMTYATWEQGFVVAPGNPLDIRTAEDLTRRKVTIVNREPGAGSRDLLDRLLTAAAIPFTAVRGYDRVCSGHLAAAQTVLAGQADCCMATRSAAVSLGLSFVAIAHERYDFVTLKRLAVDTPVKLLFDALSRSQLRQQVSALAGYDTAETGRMQT